MEKLNNINCTLKKNEVKTLESILSTELFPVLDLKPEDVEFKYAVGEKSVRVYIKGEYTQNITTEQWARIIEFENTIPQLNSDPNILID